MLTIPVDSRYLNAAIYVLFDVIAFGLFCSAITIVLELHIKYRLRRGQRVTLSGTRSSQLFGNEVSDGTWFSYFIICAHVVVLVLLFILTLGVNGRTEERLVPARRAYITRVAANYLNDYNKKRLNPQLFSSCVRRQGTSLQYYPTAFDTIGNDSIADFYAFADSTGDPVAVNAGTMVCQDSGRFPAMLTVPRCGNADGDCQNVEISSEVSVEVEGGDGGSEPRKRNAQIFVGLRDRFTVFYRNVVVKGHEFNREYNRIVCKERPEKGEVSNPDFLWFNCILGVWTKDGKKFTFRVGHGSLNDSVWSPLLDKEKVEMKFFAMSAEVEAKWNADMDGEQIFVEGLYPMSQDKTSARAFLDLVIARAVVADVSKSEVYSKEKMQVSDVEMFAVIGYGCIGLVCILLLLCNCVFAKTVRRWLLVDVIKFDATRFSGWASLVQMGYESCEDVKGGGSVHLGVTFDYMDCEYYVGPVYKDEHVVSVPQEIQCVPLRPRLSQRRAISDM